MTLAEVNSALGSKGVIHPPTDWIPITLDDNNDLSYVARALMNRDTANAITVAVYMLDAPATSRTVVIAAAGWVQGFFTRVLSSGTTGGATISGAK